MTKIIQKRPWNRVGEQVYSLSTLGENKKINMNIATYVVPITMDIKRYVLAIYKNTQTHKNIFENKNNKIFVLQALSHKQKSLVKVLGKKSGKSFDKEIYLEKKQILKTFNFQNKEYKYLDDNAFTLVLEIEKYIEVGDHDLIIAKNLQVVENNHGKILLDTNML